MTIEITKQDALMIHFALIKYSKQFDLDDDYDAREYGKLQEIDRAIGYSGNLEV